MKLMFPECKFIKNCVVTKDKNFLGSGNIDKFHALVFKVRNFNTDQVRTYLGIFYSTVFSNVIKSTKFFNQLRQLLTFYQQEEMNFKDM